MALKVPYLAALPFVDVMVAGLLEGAFLRVFKNNYTPINTSVLGDFTEADFDGYAEIELLGWSAAALNVDNKGETELAVQVFEMTGNTTPNTVYGIYVVSAANELLYAERNPAGGVLMNTAGQTYSYLPRFTAITEF